MKDVGPTLYKCNTNVLRLLGYIIRRLSRPTDEAKSFSFALNATAIHISRSINT